ncbi:hypothetical protein D3C87_1732160 [compost metagenome]
MPAADAVAADQRIARGHHRGDAQRVDLFGAHEADIDAGRKAVEHIVIDAACAELAEGIVELRHSLRDRLGRRVLARSDELFPDGWVHAGDVRAALHAASNRLAITSRATGGHTALPSMCIAALCCAGSW